MHVQTRKTLLTFKLSSSLIRFNAESKNLSKISLLSSYNDNSLNAVTSLTNSSNPSGHFDGSVPVY